MSTRGRCFVCHLEKDLKPLPVQDPEHREVVCPGCFRSLDMAVGAFQAMGYTVVQSQLSLDKYLADHPDAPESTESNVKRAKGT